MYLATYRFDGDPDALIEGYDRLMRTFPVDAILFHAAVVVEGGLLVVDACPSEAELNAFSTSPGFAAALAEAGLPDPVVEPLGAVYAARAADAPFAA